MKVLLTGCAGFVGSNILDYLLELKDIKIIGIDNFSTGKRQHIAEHLNNKNFLFHEIDLKNKDGLESLDLSKVDLVIHLAANADVRFGLDHPSKDLEENTIVTFNLLEIARKFNIKKFAFSSTGSIYGEQKVFPTPENTSFPIQTSLYGASKLACEGLIQAYSEGYGMEVYIFRLVSIMGPRYSHGHVIDFYRNLLANPTELNILGDGNQTKSYLHVRDCISAIFLIINRSKERVNIYNLGVEDTCTVRESAKWIFEYMDLKPKLTFTGGVRGWVGDNPFILLDINKLKSIGWENKFSIKDSILDTLNYLSSNSWILDES